MEIDRPPQAAQGEDLGHGGARWLGRGQSRSVQLHPCRRNSHHGFPQEGLFLLHTLLFRLFGLCFIGFRRSERFSLFGVPS